MNVPGVLLVSQICCPTNAHAAVSDDCHSFVIWAGEPIQQCDLKIR